MTNHSSVMSMKPENIPQELRSIDRWVLWKYTPKKNAAGEITWTKVPKTTSGASASSTDPSTWTTYEEAIDTFILGGYDGIGVVLDENDLHGIDLDDCRDTESGKLSDLAQRVLQQVEGYAEVSPSGTGIKIFTMTNLDSSRTKKEVGVELYRSGRYFAVTGHQLNGHEHLPQTEQDLNWLVQEVWSEQLGEVTVLEGDAADRALALYKAPLEGWDLDRVVQEVLPHLDPDCGYGEWVDVGQALHHQGQGDHEWLAAWDEWSAQSSKYIEGEPERKWRSFKPQRALGHGAITLASLLKKTKDARGVVVAQKKQQTMDDLLFDIELTMEPRELQDKVAARVADDSELSDIDRETVAAAIQARARELGVKLPIGTVRGWCKPRVARVSGSMPEWAQDWVYVTEGDKFLNLATKQEVTLQGFRAMFNRFMPVDAQGNHIRADIEVLEQWGMPVVAHKAYLPSLGPVFEMFGRQWANLYRPESVPVVPEQYTPEDLAAIEVVKAHFELYLPDARERELFLSWIAHNVQKPGVKIRWAPYVHGVPGDGKSFFADLLGCTMGGQNVRALNGSTLESNFTDWAIGAAVVVIEEMKQHGHNRYDVMNRIKPVITNSVIEVHPKGKASYTAPNASNYLILSNFLDGAPVDESDRRHMFLSSCLSTAEAIRLSNNGYFAKLFSAIQNHAGAIRGWLLGYQMHPEFDPNGRAPDTEIKRTVIDMSKTDLELAAEEIIETGAEGVCADVVSSGHLTRALEARGLDKPQTRQVANLLIRMGYRRAFAGKKWWNGQACFIWVHSDLAMSEAEIIARLGQTQAMEDFLR